MVNCSAFHIEANSYVEMYIAVEVSVFCYYTDLCLISPTSLVFYRHCTHCLHCVTDLFRLCCSVVPLLLELYDTFLIVADVVITS